MPLGQSAAALQPQTLARHRWPVLVAVQSTQAPPVGPQAPGELPMLQVPARQHPPAQGWLGPQEVVHWCSARLQADPAGQSAVALQPQEPPPLVARQSTPRLLTAQSTQ